MEEGFPESTVRYTVPAGLESLGHSTPRDPMIAPGELGLLRDTMMPKLISGELRPKNVEYAVEKSI
jgi:hypothetical protein